MAKKRAFAYSNCTENPAWIAVLQTGYSHNMHICLLGMCGIGDTCVKLIDLNRSVSTVDGENTLEEVGITSRSEYPHGNDDDYRRNEKRILEAIKQKNHK